MELRDVLTIIAIILGPIIAVKHAEERAVLKEIRERKNKLFQTLMATRANRLSASHVEALNMIELIFYGDKPVIDGWKLYLDHLGQSPETESWNQRSLDLLNDLLLTMSKSLGFDIDKLTIKKSWYSPKAHEKIERENDSIRKGLADMFQSNIIQAALQKKDEPKIVSVVPPAIENKS